jgi:hypothetical protein
LYVCMHVCMLSMYVSILCIHIDVRVCMYVCIHIHIFNLMGYKCGVYDLSASHNHLANKSLSNRNMLETLLKSVLKHFLVSLYQEMTSN